MSFVEMNLRFVNNMVNKALEAKNYDGLADRRRYVQIAKLRLDAMDTLLERQIERLGVEKLPKE